jgi:hypothetical protein
MAKEIILTKGKIAIVDDDDFDWLNQLKWFVVKSQKGIWYAARGNHGRGGFVRMHRLILSAPANALVDHINRDGLDNRRCNLRLATNAQNVCNSRPRKGLKYKGIHRAGKLWAATITIGSFESAEEAARQYDRVAKYVRGEFAYLNFPDCEPEYVI